MKIINREDFLKLPEGVLFSEYTPCVFRGLYIKDGTCIHNDYYERELIGNIDYDTSLQFVDLLELAEKDRNSLKLDFETTGRNGMYDDKQLYAVYEKEDIFNLIYSIKQCIPYE